MTTRCPAPSSLLLSALDAMPQHEAALVGAHLRGCVTCRAMIREVREVASILQSADAAPSTAEDCLDEMAIARLVDDGADAREQPDQIAHLAACAACRERLSSVSALLLDPTIVAERARTAAATRVLDTRRWRAAGVGALAAATIALMVGRPFDHARATASAPMASEGVGRHRERGMTTTTAPTPVAPVGVVATVDSFQWTSVPHADLYRLTLFDREGTTLWRGEGSDTAMVIPRGLVVGETARLYWRVEARTGWDRWVESELVEFSRASAQRIP